MFASRRREAAARKHQNLISLSNSFRPDLARRRSHGAEDIPGAVCQMPALLAINLASDTFEVKYGHSPAGGARAARGRASPPEAGELGREAAIASPPA